MQKMEQALAPNQFLRVRRPIITNVDCLWDLQPCGRTTKHGVVLTDGTERKLSRTYRDAVDEFFNGAL